MVLLGLASHLIVDGLYMQYVPLPEKGQVKYISAENNVVGDPSLETDPNAPPKIRQGTLDIDVYKKVKESDQVAISSQKVLDGPKFGDISPIMENKTTTNQNNTTENKPTGSSSATGSSLSLTIGLTLISGMILYCANNKSVF